MRQIVLIAHNVRSTHNVGSLLRTAEGMGVERVFLTGYTPHAKTSDDARLPHISQKLSAQIHKTALGAEHLVTWEYNAGIEPVIAQLKTDGFTICAVEQADGSFTLPDYDVPEKVALILGREVEGIEPEVLALADRILEIPMLGKKESFNVVQAAAMALYHCRFS